MSRKNTNIELSSPVGGGGGRTQRKQRKHRIQEQLIATAKDYSIGDVFNRRFRNRAFHLVPIERRLGTMMACHMSFSLEI